MNENDKKLKILLDDTVQEVWKGKQIENLNGKELITLRLNLLVRKRVDDEESQAVYDELIQFIDDRGWIE